MHDPINKINLDNSNTGYTLGPATCHWVQQQISWIHFFKLITPFVYISYNIPLPGYPLHQPPGFIFIEGKNIFCVICSMLFKLIKNLALETEFGLPLQTQLCLPQNIL